MYCLLRTPASKHCMELPGQYNYMHGYFRQKREIVHMRRFWSASKNIWQVQINYFIQTFDIFYLSFLKCAKCFLRTGLWFFFQNSINPHVVYLAKLASTASLNDCQLRNIYRYRYVIVIDFDEIVVPRFHRNYSHMINDIQRKYQIRDPPYQYQFVNTYFFLEFQEDTTQPQYLRTMRYRRRSPPSRHGVSASILTFANSELIEYSTSDIM